MVLDTNVLLSGLAYPANVRGRLIAAWRFGALDLVLLSDFILAELRRTLPRLFHRHGLTLPAIDDLIDSLVAALRLGSAQTLVTGDKALLALRDRYPISTPAEFWAEHGGP
ncbi:MAG: PIN domain-containing protein [Cyanobacteria bacterium]|nr:PIN domain-containing protein [Cyanobacteria bacterium bin.275]